MIADVLAVSHEIDLTDAGASLIGDWLGLADYLAEAVTSGDETVDAARAELAAAATGVIERQALEGAADIASARLGEDALITTLLRWATTHAADTADAA
jgi:hypothetical protein